MQGHRNSQRYKTAKYFFENKVRDESRDSARILPRIIEGLEVTLEEHWEKALAPIKGDLGDIDISLFLAPLWSDKSLLKIMSG